MSCFDRVHWCWRRSSKRERLRSNWRNSRRKRTKARTQNGFSWPRESMRMRYSRIRRRPGRESTRPRTTSDSCPHSKAALNIVTLQSQGIQINIDSHNKYVPPDFKVSLKELLPLVSKSANKVRYSHFGIVAIKLIADQVNIILMPTPSWDHKAIDFQKCLLLLSEPEANKGEAWIAIFIHTINFNAAILLPYHRLRH